MRYTVIYRGKLEDKLLGIWLAADDQNAVTEAANRIDKHLASHPRSQATAITPRLYELIEPPIGVAFYVSDADRLVTVVGVRRVEPQ